MIIPARAPVRPRVISPDGDGTILLEDVVSDFQKSTEDVLVIAGGIGWGKSVALGHLAASADGGSRITILDEPSVAEVCTALNVGKAVIAVDLLWKEPPDFFCRKCKLAPWTNDDLIEYLLARHPQECGSVMTRIASAVDRTLHHGRPELCVTVAERMAKDENLHTVAAALRREIVDSLGKSDRLEAAQQFSVAAVVNDRLSASKSFKGLLASGRDDRGIRLLRHDPVLLLLAADGLAAALESKRRCRWLKSRLPRQLIELTGPLLSDAAIDHLHSALRRWDRTRHAMAASLIHASRHRWIPDISGCDLTGAYLAGINWSGLRLRKTVLNKCELSGSNLTGVVLENVSAWHASFSRVVLQDGRLIGFNASGSEFREADLSEIKSESAELGGADFTDANLRGACLRGARLGAAILDGACLDEANLSKASLRNVRIEGTSFVGANLEEANLTELQFRTAKIDGAQFYCARMFQCDFEGSEAFGVNFVGADLLGANFTSARMPDANFSHANLKGAKLGDVNWEGANLTNAKLCGCTFHFGSSRSGLVGSTIAGEGSRTGFYTDDFDQQTYRPPEEIRKANLCGADLTGADLTDTDFYLVDLRRAKYTPEQFEHLRRCGAILFDRD
jgi:uncharacterized protein YjbI with pentapeptide repeats